MNYCSPTPENETPNENKFGMIIFGLILLSLTACAIYQYVTYKPEFRIVELYNESFCIQRDENPFWHSWQTIHCYDELKDAEEHLEYYKSRVNSTEIKRIIK